MHSSRDNCRQEAQIIRTRQCLNSSLVWLPRLVAVVALVAASCGDGGDPTASTGDPVSSDGADSASWLFSMNADGAAFEPTEQDGVYWLELQGLDDQMVMFTDRPERRAAVADSSVLTGDWNSAFSADPPNAVLVERASDGDAASVVVELTDPVVTGEDVTFTATVLLDDDPGQLVQGPTSYESPPDSLGPVSLFVDPLEINELGICMRAEQGSENEESTEADLKKQLEEEAGGETEKQRRICSFGR